MSDTSAPGFRYGMDLKEYEFVISHNVFTEEELERVWAGIAAGSIERAVEATWEHTVARTLTTAEIAAVLGVTRSSIARRRRTGGLHAFRYASRWRYPSWQLDSGSVIPGLEALMASTLTSMHPASVEGFMRTPQPALALNDRTITAVEWLVGGRPVERVIALIDGLAHR